MKHYFCNKYKSITDACMVETVNLRAVDWSGASNFYLSSAAKKLEFFAVIFIGGVKVLVMLKIFWWVENNISIYLLKWWTKKDVELSFGILEHRWFSWFWPNVMEN